MKPFNIFPPDVNVNFMRVRYFSLGIAALIMVVAIAAMGIKGFNFALDFTGGTVTELRSIAGSPNEELTPVFLKLTGGSGLQEIDEI